LLTGPMVCMAYAYPGSRAGGPCRPLTNRFLHIHNQRTTSDTAASPCAAAFG
jgi:hypothetical protein